jgi:arylsulfatase A-like enzyme
LQKGLVCHELVQLEDICPTVLEMAELTYPPMPLQGPYLKVSSESIPTLPGKSLFDLCCGRKPLGWRETAYSESYNAIWSITPGDWARTIRTREFRYTFYANGNGEQMFNLHQEPDEQRNIVAEAEYSEIRQELRDKLMELIVMQDYPKTRRELFAFGVH